MVRVTHVEWKTMQCNLCKKAVKSTSGLKIHQGSCKKCFLDDKNKFLDTVSESNNIVTRVTEDSTNKISRAPSEWYENTVNEAYGFKEKFSFFFHQTVQVTNWWMSSQN